MADADVQLLGSRLLNATTDLHVLQQNLNVMFQFVSGNIVLLLQAGFAFLQCGVVRTKNTTNILLVTLCDLYISGIAYFLVGWAFSRGQGNFFIGWNEFALAYIKPDDLADWFYRCVVAALVATLISGAVAERCNFMAHGIYSCVVSGFIYPVVAHWAWAPEGWLYHGNAGYKYIDFAGSGAVHVVGGACSFVAAYVIGPRIGRFDAATGQAREIKGHSMPITALGGFILVFGIVSYNAGAQRHMSLYRDGEAVALAVSNTMIAGSFGCIAALIIYKCGVFGNPKQWSFLPTLNGTITAMVATCAAGDHYPQWGAALVGVVAGFIYFGVRTIVLRLKVDDPLDATAVHFGGGAWGLISATFFANRNSLLHSDLPNTGYWLLWNLAGLAAITGWSVLTSLILFGSMKMCSMLRVSPMVELKGLDLNKHGEPAYPVEGWEEEQYNSFTEDQSDVVDEVPSRNRSVRSGILPVMSGSVRRDQDARIQSIRRENPSIRRESPNIRREKLPIPDRARV